MLMMCGIANKSNFNESCIISGNQLPSIDCTE